MKCPVCGGEMVQGIYDYGNGTCGDCWLCKDCYHIERAEPTTTKEEK